MEFDVIDTGGLEDAPSGTYVVLSEIYTLYVLISWICVAL